MVSRAVGDSTGTETAPPGQALVFTSTTVAGQVNRLKTIKRQMYGRAGVELLRARLVRLSP